jgi:hypothetical protein
MFGGLSFDIGATPQLALDLLLMRERSQQVIAGASERLGCGSLRRGQESNEERCNREQDQARKLSNSQRE